MWLIVPSSALASVPAPLGLNSDLKSPSLDTARSVWWNGKLRSPAESRRAFQKDRSLSLLNGMTLPTSRAEFGVALFISFLQDSLVSRSAWPESGREPATNGGSGPTSPASSAKSSPIASSSKTSPASCSIPIATLTDGSWKGSQKTLLGEWEPYSGTWPNSGSMRSGVVCERPTLELRTVASESSYWPTGTAHDAGGMRGNTMADHHHYPHDLAKAVDKWATPNPADSLWPTTSARDWKSGDSSETTQNRNARPLNEVAMNWGTPRVTTNNQTGNVRDDPKSRLEDQAFMWKTPHGQGNMDSSGKMGGSGGGEFAKQAQNWSTPRAEERLQHNSQDQGQALSAQVESFQSLLQDPTTQVGPSCWCGSLGCALLSHKRKLNAIFETILMGWPAWWLVSAPEPCGPWAMELWLSRQRWLLQNLCADAQMTKSVASKANLGERPVQPEAEPGPRVANT